MFVHLTFPAHTPYTASVVLQPQESAHFEVMFAPETSRVYNAQIRVLIVDNVFEEHKIQLYGEGFQVCSSLFMLNCVSTG